MPRPDVQKVAALQLAHVAKWHDAPAGTVPHDQDGFEGLALTQSGFNFLLWHEEDEARRDDVDDAEIARVKRAIDKLNQQRNDHIEQLDEVILSQLAAEIIEPAANAPINTETPIVDKGNASGSTVSMKVLSRGGVPAVLFVELPSREGLAAFPEARAVGLAGTSRSQDPAWMDRELPGAFAGLGALGAEIVLLDLLDDADLARVGGLIWARCGAEAAFVAGSSGVEYALIAHWHATGAVPAPAGTAEAGAVARWLRAYNRTRAAGPGSLR